MKKTRRNLVLSVSAFLFFFLFSPNTILGQTPKTFNYQAVLRDGENKVRGSENAAVKISLHQGSESGSEVFSELHSVRTNSFGLINLEIGAKNPSNFSLIDWSNGPYYLKVYVDGAEMGTSQLLSVPYALYAKSGGDDADADPANEIQKLSKSGNSISLSKAGGSITDAVEDADADPNNELQNISLAGNTLSLSRSGGSVALPTGGSSWTDNGSDYTYSNRNIGINTTSPGTDFEIYHSEGTVQMSHNSITVNSSNGDNRVQLTTLGNSPGWVGTYGPNKSVNTVSGFVSGYLNNGSISVLDENSNFVANMQVNSHGVGVFSTEGPNGNLNFLASYHESGFNNGFIGVFDQYNHLQAGMYIDASSKGIVQADVKNFRIAHTNLPGFDIVYTCVEGPEVAAYIRGTASLSIGAAEIVFPEHFQIVASEKSITVQITPLSANSKGLAVVQKSSKGFEVKELFDGTGNYSFDWEVKCIRKGYEDFQVIQKKDEILEGMPQSVK